jgi:hypothetical protein
MEFFGQSLLLRSSSVRQSVMHRLARGTPGPRPRFWCETKFSPLVTANAPIVSQQEEAQPGFPLPSATRAILLLETIIIVVMIMIIGG